MICFSTITHAIAASRAASSVAVKPSTISSRASPAITLSILYNVKFIILAEENFDENIKTITADGDVVGIEAFKAYYSNYITGFSDAEFNIVDAGKSRVIEIKNLGTQTIKTPYGNKQGYTLSPVQNGQPVLKNKGDMEVIYAPIKGILVPVRILIKLGSGVIELRLKKILE